MKKQSPAAGRENKPHIGIFGRCNSGKSTLLNYIVGADAAIVSPEKGTTTDVVRKSSEILDFAPVIFIDTAGVDDTSDLGRQRLQRTYEAMDEVDLALLVFRQWGAEEVKLRQRFREKELPYILINNYHASDRPQASVEGEKVIGVDATGANPEGQERVLDEIKRRLPEMSYAPPSMFVGLSRSEVVMLVCPIDSEAPAGRMILPQVQAIRELLDKHAVVIVVQPEEIEAVISRAMEPVLVVADSQVYPEVRAAVPASIEVTTFSILLAMAKGDYGLYKEGLKKVDDLKEGDRVLIAESCTHQVSCEDIGRVKIPAWLEKYTGSKLRFTVVSGMSSLPEDLSGYALVVQCGACMITRTQLRNRLHKIAKAGVPVTNYGMLIKKIRS